jgi:glycosyltransferase involved in cell wall biosynthesis
MPAAARRGEPMRIACVGELTHRKGQDVLLDAMPRIWAEAPATELHLFGDGDLADAVRARAREIDPDGRRVFVRGHVPYPYGELSGFDVFCLPTRSDNQPLAIVEALLAGVPVVATDVGGIPEMISGRTPGPWCRPAPRRRSQRRCCAWGAPSGRVRPSGRKRRRSTGSRCAAPVRRPSMPRP